MSTVLSAAKPASFHRSDLVKILIGAFLFVTVICPLAALLVNMAGSDILAVLRLPRFKEALRNSILAAGATTIISIALAWVFALCVVRSRLRFRELFLLLLVFRLLLSALMKTRKSKANFVRTNKHLRRVLVFCV